MPISLPPINRRDFLAGSAAAGAAVLLGRSAMAADGKADPHRFVLFSDTHVSGKRDEVVRGTNMFANMKQAGAEVIALGRKPSAVIVNGDCAYLHGKTEDYAVLVETLRPLREAGLPIHCVLGNHDHRPRFWQAIPAAAGQDKHVENRHLGVIESPRANWFLLDSLVVTNATPGTLGAKQLAWLGKALDARGKKPAIVMVHHNPDAKAKPSGLTDTKALMEVLTPRKHVAALLFGHTHAWHTRRQAGIHLINLPPVAYTFAQDKPNGWVDVQLGEQGAVFELRCINPKHPQHGEKLDLKWRA